MLALGDTLCAAGDAVLAAGTPAAAPALYRRAMEDGYGAALRLDQRCSDALLGLGEAQVSLGKALRIGPGAAASDASANARTLFTSGAASYAQALEVSGGRVADTFRERCDVRYNYACALALAGRGAEAIEQLRWLGARGMLGAEAAGDPDLAECRQDAYAAAWAELRLPLQR